LGCPKPFRYYIARKGFVERAKKSKTVVVGEKGAINVSNWEA
jgi:hypothetical protein